MSTAAERRRDGSEHSAALDAPLELRRAGQSWLETLLVRHERSLRWFCLATILISAWTSETFYHKDEHYQIVEFVGLKLGFTKTADLAWEYEARIRPWLQPALYYALVKPLLGLGVEDRFALVFVMRLFSGLLSWFAITALLRVSRSWFASSEGRTWSLRWLTLAGCIPFLAVRTSSETFSAAFQIFGIAVLGDSLTADGRNAPSSLRPRTLLASGVLCGLAVQFRYQIAFCSVGLFLWLALVARARLGSLAAFAAGALPTVALGALVDRWGYGAWVFPPWTYLWVNLVEGKAAEFGTNWFGAYLHLCLANVFAPVAALALVGLLACWLRRPRHLLTFVTLPFVLAHCVLAHKEDRFLFPIAMLALVAAALGFEPGVQRSAQTAVQRFVARVPPAFAAFRRTLAYRALVALNAMALALSLLGPISWRPRLGLARWVHDHVQQPADFVLHEPLYDLLYPFYLRSDVSIGSAEELRARTTPAEGRPQYLLVAQPFTPPEGHDLGEHPRVLYSEFPGHQLAWLRRLAYPELARLRPWLGAHGFPAARLTWVSVYALPEARR